MSDTDRIRELRAALSRLLERLYQADATERGNAGIEEATRAGEYVLAATDPVLEFGA